MWYRKEICRMVEKITDWKFLRMIYTATKVLYEKSGVG